MFYIQVLWNGDAKFTLYGESYIKSEEAFKDVDKILNKLPDMIKKVSVFNEHGKEVKRKAKIRKRPR